MPALSRPFQKSTNVRIILICGLAAASTLRLDARQSSLPTDLSEPLRIAAEASMREGAMQMKQGDWEKARRAFAQAATFNPALAGAHYNLGVTLGVLNRGDEAIKA